METQEVSTQETNIEDLTVSEDTAAEVKGSEGGTGKTTIYDFSFMKKVDK